MDAGINVTLIVDGAAAPLLHSGRVDAVVVGADRIAANGDTANKVGTFGLALAARHAGVPFYVAAPSSTFDLATPPATRSSSRSGRPRRCAAGRDTPPRRATSRSGIPLSTSRRTRS